MDFNNILSDPIFQPYLSELEESFSWSRANPDEIIPDSIVPWLKNKRSERPKEKFIPRFKKRPWWERLMNPPGRPMTDKEIGKEKMRFGFCRS